MKRAVFLERDALLNLAASKGGQQKSPTTLEEFRINEAALPALQRLKSAGFVLIATTNQPEISRGTLSRRELDRMHEMLAATLPLDDILVCPHDEEDDCPCRKPRAGLFHEAAFKYHLLLGQSFLISNRWQDAEAARLIGSTSLAIDSPWLGRGHHDFAVRDLEAAIEKVMEREKFHRKVA
jgi:D-glycero-D-manno-heptose 1,7-bisphosphate phosphatase